MHLRWIQIAWILYTSCCLTQHQVSMTNIILQLQFNSEAVNDDGSEEGQCSRIRRVPLRYPFDNFLSWSSHAISMSKFLEDDAVEVIEETPEEVKYLRGLDPNNWKEQDHYHVLGLQDSRANATEKEIKAAFRRKVRAHCLWNREEDSSSVDLCFEDSQITFFLLILKQVLRHHPDKRASKGEKIENIEGDYFSCITRAYEVLSNPKQRQVMDKNPCTRYLRRISSVHV